MDNQDTDEEIFEISDFTNATEWESFIAAIEKVFHQWDLAASDPHTDDGSGVPKQHRKSERVTYCGRNFVISLEVGGAECYDHAHSNEGSKSTWAPAMTELLDPRNDFPPKAHHLSRWYGLSKFVLIAPSEGETALTSQAQAKLMLSSVSIAVTNTGCVTPVFVQIHHKWRQMYVGVCEGRDVRVNFDMVHLRQTPPQFGHLSGLLDLFKAKLRCVPEKLDPVQIAVRYTYVLKHWSLDDWPVESLDPSEREGGLGHSKSLPVGAISDPVQELHLSAVWPNLSEELIADSKTHSDLKPTHAPIWTVISHLCDNPSCLLSEHLHSFLRICYRQETVSDLIGNRITQDNNGAGTPNQGFSQALNRLTAPPAANMASPFLDSVVGSTYQRSEYNVQGGSSLEALPDTELEIVMKCLFPDAYEKASQSSSPPYTSPSTSHKMAASSKQNILVGKLKSAPVDSLTFLLANSLCILNNEYGLKAFALVWYEVVQELRYRWENAASLKNLPEGHPDMGCCILHQKLQMLNCCIQHKLSHEQKLHTPNVPIPHPSTNRKPHTASFDSKNRNTDTNTSESLNSLEFKTPNSSINFSNSGKTVQDSVSGDHKQGVSCDTRGSSHDQRITRTSESESDSDEFYEALETHDEDDPRDNADVVHTNADETNSSREQDMDVSEYSCEIVSGLSEDGEAGEHNVEGVSVGRDPEESRLEGVSVGRDPEESRVEDVSVGGDPEESGVEGVSAGGDPEESGVEGVNVGADPGESGVEGVNVDSEPGESDVEGEGRVSVERAGALEPCGNLILIATGEQLYIPVTQEHTPMTEDMLTEQANILSRLGTSEEAAKVRAKMQSSSLISDMQAFKAANPRCLLGDFVRWYSPRDWIEDKVPVHTTSDQSTPIKDDQQTAEVSNEEEIKMETEEEGGNDIHDVPVPSADISDGSQATQCEERDQIDNEVEASPSRGIEAEGSSNTADTQQTNRMLHVVNSDSKDYGDADSAPGDGWEDEDWDVIESDVDREEVISDESEEKLPKRFVKGCLSARMLLPDNIWVETWNSATPLPAYKQKRLFDDTREAEKLLHFLAGLSPASVALHLMPVLLHSAISVVQERQSKCPLAAVDSLLVDVVALLATVQQPSLDSLPKYQECISLLSQAEHLLAAAHSLRSKLDQGLELSGGGGTESSSSYGVSSKGTHKRGELEVSAELMLAGPELVMKDPTNSVTGTALKGLLTAQAAIGDLEDILEPPDQSVSTETFPQPSGREYILRTVVPRPSPLSLPSPQRMFCVLTGGEFRLAGAFGYDTKLI